MGPDAAAGWGEPDPDGQTLLTADELRDLIPREVTSRDELNEAEQANIGRAFTRRKWRRRRTPEQLLDDLIVRDLHRDMFGDVWRWAGTYRMTERNIGVAPTEVSSQVRNLVDDAMFWFSGSLPWPPDEAACRFHHRLVQIHPFPNGNGRHARVMTDLLLRSVGQPSFTWGGSSIVRGGTVRADYLRALRDADTGDFEGLQDFVRS